MSEIKDNIRSMIQNLIKDDNSQAELNLHPVFTAKMKEIVGVKQEAAVTTEDDD